MDGIGGSVTLGGGRVTLGTAGIGGSVTFGTAGTAGMGAIAAFGTAGMGGKATAGTVGTAAGAAAAGVVTSSARRRAASLGLLSMSAMASAVAKRTEAEAMGDLDVLTAGH